MAESDFRHEVMGQFEYEGMVMGLGFPKDQLDRIKEKEFKEEDILISTYAKAGTTWCQEILWSIVTNGDFEGAKKAPIIARSPFIEMKLQKEGHSYDGLDIMETLPSPRVLKTHLGYEFFEKTFKKTQPRTIVVMRNLKDNLVSYFHFYRLMAFFNFSEGTWDQFFTLYKRRHLVHGDWFDFNLSWWNQRHDPRVLILTYEDMKQDIRKEIRKICKFIEKPITDELMEGIVAHTAFDQMRDNKMVNYEFVGKDNIRSDRKFMRKGQVGDWVNHFTPEQTALVDQQLEEKLAGTGLSFRES